MKKSSPKMKFDAAAYWDDVQGQFQNLDRNDPSRWPVLPRTLLCLGLTLLTAGAAWYFYLSDFEQDLERERAQEVTLRTDYEQKLLKAVSLEGLKKQREQVQQYVNQLEKQLPSKSEMAALLSDINQAGIGRSLQFELFKPGSEEVKDYYAELPITVRVAGQFHDMGMFVSDVAHLSRIVTLSNIAVAPKSTDGILVLDATARTYRYLDPDEVAAQRAAANAAKRGNQK